jgi:uncharacterized LabA/DUF88 family protein
MDDPTTYLFIDGSYLREIYSGAMNAVFGASEDLLPDVIATDVRAFKTFFYDCPDEIKKGSESDEAFAARKMATEEYFARIRSLRGFHVQTGTMRGRRRREQKEVDVLLAVDMLTHGFNRNMTHAVLLAGDLDFRPVVEALIRGGIFVQVMYERTSASKDLYEAADYGIPLNWRDLYNWSSDSFKAAYRLPDVTANAGQIATSTAIKSGTVRDSPVHIIRSGDRFVMVVYRWNDRSLMLTHADQLVLERFFALNYVPIDWKP